MAPKLTIITPVYNAEGLLGRALASLQSQTLGFENLRWVLVDDQSTDCLLYTSPGGAGRGLRRGILHPRPGGRLCPGRAAGASGGL